MKEKTLVIMAAGMGSRFGGFKQIEPVGPHGEFIIDYSVYDAKKVGFTKVIFIIKKELEEAFKKTIGKRISKQIKVEYAFQEIEYIPESKRYLAQERKKPWGTVHAILCAKNLIDGDFVVINADDFYGYSALQMASEFLDQKTDENVYACITFQYNKTASKFGSVKRGVCFGNDDNITEIIESSVESKETYALATPINGAKPFAIDLEHPVSMNLFAFKYSFLSYLEDYFNQIFAQDDEAILKSEALIAETVKELLDNKKIVLKNITSTSKWLGMTYREDLEDVKNEIKNLIDNNIYPDELWEVIL